jgi:hypothetical protein
VASSGGGRCHGDEDGGATGGWVSGGARGVAQRKLETKVRGKGQRRRRGGKGGTRQRQSHRLMKGEGVACSSYPAICYSNHLVFYLLVGSHGLSIFKKNEFYLTDNR